MGFLWSRGSRTVICWLKGTQNQCAVTSRGNNQVDAQAALPAQWGTFYCIWDSITLSTVRTSAQPVLSENTHYVQKSHWGQGSDENSDCPLWSVSPFGPLFRDLHNSCPWTLNTVYLKALACHSSLHMYGIAPEKSLLEGLLLIAMKFFYVLAADGFCLNV